MRIWHQSALELETLPQYAESLSRRYAAVAAPGTHVVLHGVRAGTYGALSPAQALANPVARARVTNILIEQMRSAAQQGFDAVMIASFAELGLREVRAQLPIPVTSMAESSYLSSCSAACRVGVVTISRAGAQMLDAGIARHGLGSRVLPVIALDPDFDEPTLQAAFAQPATLRASFETGCRKAIAAGAGVILPGEGVLNEFVAHHGLREVDGVGVIDAIALTVMHTEMLVRAYAAAGMQTGRGWSTPAEAHRS